MSWNRASDEGASSTNQKRLVVVVESLCVLVIESRSLEHDVLYFVLFVVLEWANSVNTTVLAIGQSLETLPSTDLLFHSALSVVFARDVARHFLEPLHLGVFPEGALGNVLVIYFFAVFDLHSTCEFESEKPEIEELELYDRSYAGYPAGRVSVIPEYAPSL